MSIIRFTSAVAILALTLAAQDQHSVPPPPVDGVRDYVYPNQRPIPRDVAAAAAPEPADGTTVSYKAFDGTQYTLVQYNGTYVAFLIQPSSLALGRYTEAQLRAVIDHIDVTYTHFRDLMGGEPSGTTPLLHIAFVKTCGGGCGWIGAKGIELAPEMLDPANTEYGGADYTSPYSIYAFVTHEMTHNFDFYSSYIMYGPDVGHSWTDFMNFYLHVYDQEGAIDSGAKYYPLALMQSTVDRYFTPYLGFPNFNWTACVQNNTCDSANSMAQHAQGGMAMRIAQLHYPEAVKPAIQYLKSAIASRHLDAAKMDVLGKNDLLLESLANGARANVVCYVDQWKWPISSTLRAQLATAFGDNANCVDHDGDGYSVVQGDCNDHNAAVHPGGVEVLDGLDNDCNGIVDDVLITENYRIRSVGLIAYERESSLPNPRSHSKFER